VIIAAVPATVNAVFERLARRVSRGVRGACDDRNVSMKKYLEKPGSYEVEAVPLSTRTIRAHEKPLPPSMRPAADVPPGFRPVAGRGVRP
jgi:hypothetical protein